MLLLKYLLLTAGFGLLAGALAIVVYDIFNAIQYRRMLAAGAATAPHPPHAVRLRLAGKLAVIAWLPLLLSLSIVVVPSGMAGVAVSQFSGTRPGALHPGVHFVLPLVESVALYDTREHVFTTAGADDPKKKAEVLKVQAREGLSIGLAVTVRYRLDTKRLDYIHANLPGAIDEELVAPVVASVFRQSIPNFTVREVFATRREEIRKSATEAISTRLGSDGILVKEVMLRDIVLPVEYARGLEGLLLKEQENERLAVETEIKQKQVRTAELEAEAQKVREVKHAEASAQVRVLQAKSEADAMQYTLPLKQKQIEQSRLEAEARKESTLKNAEASAQAKVIDSKAELEKRKYLAEAEANRIRVTATADAERMKLEALVLKQNPMLIQKIIAERLSDKLQMIMVPSDGKYFFANDVLRSAFSGNSVTQPDDPEDPPRRPNGSRPPQ
ncbi:MAG: SPFH domain-containing protein [Acidobacteria bacterium]|nr:SPFH domain-containing protein [Acidobacteriota bacterium]MCL5288149.1 SPFH domain-containing protein [Acidobacteriota bacterium]